MNAWLLTWAHTSNEPSEKLVAILPARRSDRAIAELMELFVLRATTGASSAAYYLHRRKQMVYKARTPLVINRVPHGNRILCGHDPWLYGRVVRELVVVVDCEANEEVVSWREPDDFEFKDNSLLLIDVAKPGRLVTLRRPNCPLSKDAAAR